jgi:hypothetical protein
MPKHLGALRLSEERPGVQGTVSENPKASEPTSANQLSEKN